MGCRMWTLACIIAVLNIKDATSEPVALSATERGLTATEITAAKLAEEGDQYHQNVAACKRFTGSVLGYVTPWNARGYDVAVRWRAKFTHISPVWYQLKGDSSTTHDGSVKLTGGHDVDQKWIARLREPASQESNCAADPAGDASSQTCTSHPMTPTPPLLVPRFISELTPNELTAVLQKPGRAIAAVVDECEEQGFDGLVFEGWLQWAAMGGFTNKDFTRLALEFIKKLAANLRDKNKILLLAVPPAVPSFTGRPHAETSQLQQLASEVSGFSLMTYDFATGDAGPNAPIAWQEENVNQLIAQPKTGTSVHPTQVFMGLNFYGYDYSKPESASKNSKPTNIQAIMGDAFLKALKRHKPKLVWQEKYAEHRARYKEGGIRHTVYYPTPASLAARLQLAQRLGVGLSIWELGQGIDVFMDLL